MKKLAIVCMLVSSFICPITLDELAHKYGTDKGSGYREGDGASGHNYAHIYESYFAPLRNNSIKLLEIGFWHGSSARMWDEYFPRGELYFIDINKELIDRYSTQLSSRCRVYVADQSSYSSLDQLLHKIGSDFDIIIDDGSHRSEHQIISFKMLFPHLKSEGIYIIEDLHAAYWKYYGGQGTTANPQIGSNSIITFLLSLVHDVNFVGATTECADYNKCLPHIRQKMSYYQQHIKSVHFYDSMCFILKR